VFPVRHSTSSQWSRYCFRKVWTFFIITDILFGLHQMIHPVSASISEHCRDVLFNDPLVNFVTEYPPDLKHLDVCIRVRQFSKRCLCFCLLSIQNLLCSTFSSSQRSPLPRFLGLSRYSRNEIWHRVSGILGSCGIFSTELKESKKLAIPPCGSWSISSRLTTDSGSAKVTSVPIIVW